MFKSRLLLGICCVFGMFAACEKTAPYDEASQLAIDDAIIQEWKARDTVTFTKHPSGVYYKISKPGTGTQTIELADLLSVQYRGWVLGADSAFSEALIDDTLKVTLNAVMPGWQQTVPLIKAGGTIRLIIPSTLAYQNRPVSYGSANRQNLPPNSILDFVIDVRKVEKSK